MSENGKIESIQEDSLENFAANLWAILDIKPPLDVLLIAERFGVKLKKNFLGLEISGLAFSNQNGTRFAITNQVEHPTRQRFVGLHEIAHHLFDEPIEGIILMDRRMNRSDELSVDPSEIRADRFAAALLMPEIWIKSLWGEYRHNREYRIEILANRFDVSINAVRFRVRELNMDGFSETINIW